MDNMDKTDTNTTKNDGWDTPIVTAVSRRYVTVQFRGCPHQISWGLLRSAAYQTDPELGGAYRRLLNEARDAARELQMLTRRYTFAGATSSHALEAVMVGRAEGAGSREMVGIVEYDPDDPDGRDHWGAVRAEVDPRTACTRA